MTDKLHCPFCDKELEEFTNTYFKCPNQKCMSSAFIFASREAWENIIVGKKAQDALIGIGKILLLDSGKPSVLTVKGKQEIKRKITSIAKGKNNE